MEAFLIDFGNMLLRWLHVIAAIAWIGESFYFVMLDNSLRDPVDPEDKKAGVFGEQWAVHGGGFYHNLKFQTAPAKLPEHLHWSFLKAYTTWLSGFALFLLLYLSHPSAYLANYSSSWGFVSGLGDWGFRIAALVYLLLGWIVYDQLCRRISPTMEKDGVLSVAVAIMMAVFAYVAIQLFSGRAAFLLTGAVMATAMAANVYFWIIPGQRRMVNAMKAGEEPDPLDGKRGKQRSVHNTYFTLPVVFLMISNHYSFLYTSEHAYALILMFIVAGGLIRQFFVLMHAGYIKHWYYVVGALFVVGAFIVAAPFTFGSSDNEQAAASNPQQSQQVAEQGEQNAAQEGANTQEVASSGASKVTYKDVKPILQKRCVECHSENPTSDLFSSAPAGIHLDHKREVLGHYNKIKDVVASNYMPLGNMTGMTDEEREIIARWVKK